MLPTVFTILPEIEPQNIGLREDLWVLLAGIGLIVFVFVLRRWLGDGNNKTNLRF
ncbi:MAG: hypothetical protein M3209_01435 [Acidobacteriota bacterium]|nr:hypothetical protein [Acidobacteriota bacterium]